VENTLKQSLWNQFAASIDMLEHAIQMCPTILWNNESNFWRISYHTLFFLDYYLTLPPTNFTPPTPFTLSEFDDETPEKVYTKAALLQYLHFCKTKCNHLINSTALLDEKIIWENESKTMQYPIIEILLYNLRHVQHHVAQLNLLLRKHINEVPSWIFRGQ
jgi:DinB superfamily